MYKSVAPALFEDESNEVDTTDSKIVANVRDSRLVETSTSAFLRYDRRIPSSS